MPEDAIARLRADLAAARFTVDDLEALWGTEAAEALRRDQSIPAKRATEGVESPLALLARLFVLGEPATIDEVDRALPSLGATGCVDLGLVRIEAQTVKAIRDLRPYSFTDSLGSEQWWICSDLGELALGHPLPDDHVLGVGGATTTLARLMVTDPVDAVLDLGTGCGIQAMHASRHARRVVATDVSERALETARFNAALNGIDTIEFRLGDLFEPVAGERFDQVVSNPPFVITPRDGSVSTYDYRDAGLVGDAVVEKIFRGVREHLVPGGMAQLLGNWEYRPDGLDRVRTWVDESALDAWVVEREVQSPIDYAQTWIRDGGTLPGTPEFDRLCRAWLDDFAARGVTAVGFGYVFLRRPRAGAPSLRRFERLTSPLPAQSGGLGQHWARAVAAHDRLQGDDLSAVASVRAVVADDVTEERHYWPGHADPAVITLVQGGAFGRRYDADGALAGLVGACDGDLSIGSICAALAELFGVDEASLTESLTPQVRELLITGFLRFA